jgi:protein-tyrosine phosphatase
MLQPLWRKPAGQPRIRQKIENHVPKSPQTPAVLFVCTANRIRSPLAQYMLLDLLRKHNSEMSAPNLPWRVESAGVWAEEGLPVLELVIKIGREHGLDLSRHRSRSAAAIGIHQYDLILTMEHVHAATLCNEFPQICGRVMTVGAALAGREFDVVDPPHQSRRAVRATARELAALLATGLTRLQEHMDLAMQPNTMPFKHLTVHPGE